MPESFIFVPHLIKIFPCLARVVVQAGAGGHPLPQRLSHPHEHSLHDAHAVLGQWPVLIIDKYKFELNNAKLRSVFF